MANELLTLKDGRYFIDEEQSKIYKSIEDRQPYLSNQYKWDEMSMADLFADCYRHCLLYCPENKSWYSYDGSVWIRDVGGILATDKLKEFVKLLNLYASQLDDSIDNVEEYRKFVRKLTDRRVRDRILKDAQSEACVYLQQFDINPYYINCENGTYDLEHDSFHFHRPEDYLTMKTNCVYILPNTTDNYKCDRFFQFLNEIMCNDKEKLNYLHRALGYSLSGVPSEECMFFAWGKTTRNGKGTLFNTIQTVLGDYATTVSSKIICRTKEVDANAPNPALCSIKGKRIVFMSETSKKSHLDEEIVKSYTGNDMLSTRTLYGEQFNMKLQCSFWLMCNHLPQTNDKTLFSSDRAKVVTFEKHFDDDERDTTLKTQFTTKEAKAVILKWMIDGYKKYVKDKLKMPQVIKQAISIYEEKDDIVKMFINECCVLDSGSKTLKTLIYENFECWRKRGEYPYMSKQAFYSEMADRFETKNNQGYIYYKGVSLK